ncbi:hypothetical protein [Natronorubrum texcoconense]|uniref:Uncharacterized protein n=1 Tax=Natronorubrum texcoconense TaxID=1095776 RepID=A0A1G8Y949_9EURY|nr:hypothetical protein [Natronorubrum texcoconense]SDJ99372.1 hypothetical protein SAMN04515672_2075 [Natronorubrum texcoconense]
MDSRFRDWLTCPSCTDGDDVGILVHGTDLVLECYDCGHVAEFTVEEDVPFNSLQAEDLESVAREQRHD